jgi:hypothetical protein
VATTELNRLAQDLVPLQRNNFYYGKLMDVLHTQMEQDYGVLARRLLNRHVFGRGVICGLQVSSIGNVDKPMLLVTAGLAIDGWGREIIVPHDVTVSPVQLTDGCGCAPTTAAATQASPASAAPTAGRVVANVAPLTLPPPPPPRRTISVCYQECPTDLQPALVSDPTCDRGQRCEAGTVVESYCLRVTDLLPPPVRDFCPENIHNLIATGQLQRALCALSQTCGPEPSDPCVNLAAAQLNQQTSLWVVDSCDFRNLVPTNGELFQLLTCLAQIVEQCCGGKRGPTTAPTEVPTMAPSESPTSAPTQAPTTAPSQPPTTGPTLPPERTTPDFRVKAVRILSAGESPATGPGKEIAVLTAPKDKWSRKVTRRQLPDAVEFEFENATVDPKSVTYGRSFQVTGPTPGQDPGGGIVSIPTRNAIRWSTMASTPGVKVMSPQLLPGNYTITLNSSMAAPNDSVRSLPAPMKPVLLDGDPTQIPSGNGSEGSSFECTFTVA